MKKIYLFTALFITLFTNAQLFQDTKGNLEISNSGQVSYTLPIAMPPSIKNVAPVINLTYSSGQRGGIAGQGWNISSISSISRISTRADIDGFRDGVDFDNNDKLALDGQRLLLKTGTYWANGSTYETEYKSNTKIQMDIVGIHTLFIVTYPDGSQAKYGNISLITTDNANSLNSWFIKEFKDIYGNTILYNYKNFEYQGTSQNYIDNINFSINDSQGIKKGNIIQFNYRSTNVGRVEMDFVKGQEVYAFKILDNIQVLTSDALFRKYQLTQVADSSGYERVTQIQEFNGIGEASNPILFSYEESQPDYICSPPSNSCGSTPGSGNLCPTRAQYNLPSGNNSVLNFNDVQLTGDFDGDGKLDFITGDKIYTKLLNGYSITAPITPPVTLPFFASKYTTFAGTMLVNNKLEQKNCIINIEDTFSGTVVNCYSLNGSTITNIFSQYIPLSILTTYTTLNTDIYLPGEDAYYVCGSPSNCGQFGSGQSTANLGLTEISVGDYNGDGISEILIQKPSDITYIQDNVVAHTDTGICQFCNQSQSATAPEYYILDLNTNNINNFQLVDPIDNLNGTKYIQDFNGDGKSDILVYRFGNYKLYSIDEDANSTKTLNLIGQGTLSNSFGKPLLFGDYNGDGKSDIMIPNAIDSNVWTIHYANPSPSFMSFFNAKSYTFPTTYHPTQVGETYHDVTTYHAMDINKDGKSDLVSVYLNEYKYTGCSGLDANNWDSTYKITAFTNNIGKGNETFVQTYQSPVGWSDSPYAPTLVTAGYNFLGQLSDLVIIDSFENRVNYYKFNSDFAANNRLKTVTESNGNIVQSIDYLPMLDFNNSLQANFEFYSSTNMANYPYMEVIKNSENYLVSKLTATINGAAKFQDFKYKSMISNFEFGTIGFSKTARSSWYTSTNTSKIWTVQNNDYNLRGANTITWTTTAANFFNGIPANLLSSKTNEFEVYTNPLTKVYNVLLKKQTTKDWLTNVINETEFTYDGLVNDDASFGLQIKNNTKTYLGTDLQGINIVETTYENNATGSSNSYFVGKPKTVDTSKIIYPNDVAKTDIRTSREIYSYTGPNITKSVKNGHNTPNSIIEDMTYDGVGNLLTKTISCPGGQLTSRTVIDEYDTDTKRFVIRKTDHQGFQTLFQYNNIGQVIQSTNYLGVTSNFVFDNWGKLISTTTTGATSSTLINTNAYTKLTDGGYTTTNTNNVDAAVNTTRYDVLGRIVKNTTKGFAPGTTISKSIIYDVLGRKIKEYEPYFTTLGNYTSYVYDYLQRPILVTASTGRIQTITYNGLTTNSLDDTKATTATLDALGNKVSTTDEGGTINFMYYANGQLKESDYDGHKINIEIDGWGNKTSTTDPNAGTYTYQTNEFGELKLETTPKGTTKYDYDNFGKLSQKIILGDGADYIITSNYNTFAQLISEISKKADNTPIDTFLYEYDSLHRLNSTSETNTNFKHNKTISFDSYGRILLKNNQTAEIVTGFSSGFISKNNYNTYNGIMDKMTDANNVVLWQLNSSNEKMQTLSATLGNGIVTTNVYDGNNYFVSQRHQKNSTDIIYNTYNFNAVKGTLNNRQNVVLGTNESFSYDNLDRLIKWTNPITNTDSNQSYDLRGRIDVNNLGTYKYNNPAYVGMYRKTSIDLSIAGFGYYSSKPIQRVKYTMFKTPITINESGTGATIFTYNSHLSRTKMLFGFSTVGATSTYNKSKLYIDDKSTEIIKTVNKITIITYIGGDAYSAPLYNETAKDLITGKITNNNYYLHRDYLGSIIAISDSNGVAVERRQFDAWGVLSKLQKNGFTIPIQTVGDGVAALMLDRGYTSHEHLAEVGLIQMNGRLYDPVLRTFLMPDNFVQQPENTQNYNRYAYVLNNPLMYTDPSGEIIPLLAAVAIGAFIGGSTYYVTCLTTGQNFSYSGLAQATFIGAASAAVTFGIGNGANSLFTAAEQFSKAAFQAVAHGLVQGGMTAVQGGNFWNGFSAGAISSIASSAFSFDGNGVKTDGLGWASSVRNSDAGMIAFGTIAGGVGASLTGGNFWQGAVTGLIVAGLNHAMHQIDIEDPTKDTATKDSCIDCPKNGSNENFNSMDGKTYIYTKGNWHSLGKTILIPGSNKGPTLKQIDNSSNKSDGVFGQKGPYGSSPLGAGTEYKDEQNELLYLAQAISNGGTLLINGTKFIFNTLFTFKPMNPAPPPLDSSHIGF